MSNSVPFFKYFFSYIFKSRTRQRLLFIAIVGLFLSSFSLIVIQGIMGGLQKGLIARSKFIHGHHLIQFVDITNEKSVEDLKQILESHKIPYQFEIELEVMLKNKSFLAPAKIHGIDTQQSKPLFLEDKDFKGLVLGSELSGKLKLQFMDEVQIIAPGVTDSLLGEVPRFITESLTDYVYTEMSEVDEFEAWSRVSLLQNLLRQRGFNQVRIFSKVSDDVKDKILKLPFEQNIRWLTWEMMNQSLVWSLNLETNVMLFLFISMSLLVAIAITSGLLIFYSKISRDLMSFWILGMSQSKLLSLCYRFTAFLSGITCIVGASMGYLCLRILEVKGHDIMPDIFVERTFPIDLNFGHVILGLFIPFGISLIFSYFSFSYFKKENQSFVSIVRSLG